MVLRSDVPLPSTGSLQVRFPCFPGTMRTLRRLAARFASLRFLRSAIPFIACAHLVRSREHPDASARRPGISCFGDPPPDSEGMETTRPPRFLDDPPHICPVLGPRSSRYVRPLRHIGAAPVFATTKASAIITFRGSIARLLCSPPTLRARVAPMLRKDGS